MSIKSDILAERLESLRQAFREQLPSRIETINEFVKKLFAVPGDIETITRLRQNAHSLAGAGGSFGYLRLSEKARELEECLAPLIEHKKVPTDSDLEILGCLFSEIVDLADKGTDDSRNYSRQK